VKVAGTDTTVEQGKEAVQRAKGTVEQQVDKARQEG
jgi:hypothetical protein